MSQPDRILRATGDTVTHFITEDFHGDDPWGRKIPDVCQTAKPATVCTCGENRIEWSDE